MLDHGKFSLFTLHTHTQTDTHTYGYYIIRIWKNMALVAREFLLQVREISYEYHEYQFLTKGIDKRCFLVVQVVLVGKEMYERNRPYIIRIKDIK